MSEPLVVEDVAYFAQCFVSILSVKLLIVSFGQTANYVAAMLGNI